MQTLYLQAVTDFTIDCYLYEVTETDSEGVKPLINLSFYLVPQTIVASFITAFSNAFLGNWVA